MMQPASGHVGFVSPGPETTKAFGRMLGSAMSPGDLLLLHGPFGAGKTTLVQGIAAGLLVEGKVTSPSFTLINEYEGRHRLHHVDLFRLDALDAEIEQSIESCREAGGVTVIEWPQLVPGELGEGALRADLEVLGESERSLVFHAEGTRWSGDVLVQMMKAALEETTGEIGMP